MGQDMVISSLWEVKFRWQNLDKNCQYFMLKLFHMFLLPMKNTNQVNKIT